MAPITKRQLGIGFIFMGAAAAVTLLAIDLLGAGQFQGVGPAQRRALLMAGIVILLGISLLPLGDRAA
jgi:hypothetical protein